MELKKTPYKMAVRAVQSGEGYIKKDDGVYLIFTFCEVKEVGDTIRRISWNSLDHLELDKRGTTVPELLDTLRVDNEHA